MSETSAPETTVPATTEATAPATPAPAPSSRRAARHGAPSGGGWNGPAGGVWRRWLGASAALGAIMGAAWFVLAPGGAIFGDGSDFSAWFPRDASLAALLLVAGGLSAVLLLRQGRRDPQTWSSAAPTMALLVGGLAGSVIAWRVGVFAGDLFHTVPGNLANPSILFSLRSGPVLLLWPLASAVVLFVVHFVRQYFVQPSAERPDRPQPAVSQPAGPASAAHQPDS